jgi:mitochondrial fission protein ELM1
MFGGAVSLSPAACKPDATRQPSVWLLIDDRPGHATQVRGLARLLAWEATEKHLTFNMLNHLPNPLLGATPMSLAGSSHELLKPPFPDLVVGMGRRILPVARWIKAQSGGTTRTVMLGRKAVGGASGVDLHVGCQHFRLLPHSNLFELTVPPCQVDPESLRQARDARANPMADLKRPHVVALVGGPTAQHRFSPEFAGLMVKQLDAATAKLGGSLAIVTSRRTPEACIAAMRAAAPHAHLHAWTAHQEDNPYLSYLAWADDLVVTGESESMLAEALATQLPVTLYRLEPRPPKLEARLALALRHAAESESWLGAVGRRIVGGGWLSVPRDLDLLHERLGAGGLAKVFDGTINTVPPQSTDDSARLAARIRGLFADASPR